MHIIPEHFMQALLHMATSHLHPQQRCFSEVQPLLVYVLDFMGLFWHTFWHNSCFDKMMDCLWHLQATDHRIG
jgi:hypothetical protein